MVEDFTARGLARESDGAQCVFLPDYESPMIIRKKDGAFLYATTDLATIQYRMETWHPDAILYVVDHRQSEHFGKLFAAARLWGYDQVELRHISFGTVLGEDGRPYRTRSGDVVGLEGLLDEAIRRALAVVAANDDAKPAGPELTAEQRQAIARAVGHAALKYADLSHNRTSDYVFSYDKMVALDGNTATYMQYSYARTQSIFQRGNIDVAALRAADYAIPLHRECGTGSGHRTGPVRRRAGQESGGLSSQRADRPTCSRWRRSSPGSTSSATCCGPSRRRCGTAAWCCATWPDARSSKDWPCWVSAWSTRCERAPPCGEVLVATRGWCVGMNGIEQGETWRNSILCGDALEQLGRLPAGVVDTIVTSPPYYRQRDYTGADQVGHEATPAAYVQRLVGIFAACRRVLPESGSLWLVLGDKYDDGQQLGMPWRVALALIDDGWILRSDIIWHKPNAMPSAVKTRPTTDHEYVFFLTKSKHYYYDADAIREPHVTFTEQSRMRGGRRHFFHRDGTPEQGKNGGTPICTRDAGIRRFIRRVATSAPSGRFRSPSSARPTSPCIPRNWWRPVCGPAVRRAESCSIRFWEVARRRWWRGDWDATSWASTASPNTAGWRRSDCSAPHARDRPPR